MISHQLDGVQVWVATTPVDMRKSFDGLAEVVRSQLGRDPLSGNLFVFRNRGGHLIKILWWDHGGLTIHYRRLERGAFPFPASDATCVTTTCRCIGWSGSSSGKKSRSHAARCVHGCGPPASWWFRW